MGRRREPVSVAPDVAARLRDFAGSLTSKDEVRAAFTALKLRWRSMDQRAVLAARQQLAEGDHVQWETKLWPSVRTGVILRFGSRNAIVQEDKNPQKLGGVQWRIAPQFLTKLPAGPAARKAGRR